MGEFSHHERCPSCTKQGADRKGDNLARYKDGSAWCFSCEYWEPATHRPDTAYEQKEVRSVETLLDQIPSDYDAWLNKYSLTSEEKSLFKWDPTAQRLIYQVRTLGKLKYQEGRSLTQHPKCLSEGEKPYHILNDKHSTVCIVEDIISAIKVSRHCAALPLFGSSLNSVHELFLGATYGQIFVWLDYDKYPKAVKMARSLAKYGGAVEVIRTHDDPKDCDTKTILESKITII